MQNNWAVFITTKPPRRLRTEDVSLAVVRFRLVQLVNAEPNRRRLRGPIHITGIKNIKTKTKTHIFLIRRHTPAFCSVSRPVS